MHCNCIKSQQALTACTSSSRQRPCVQSRLAFDSGSNKRRRLTHCRSDHQTWKVQGARCKQSSDHVPACLRTRAAATDLEPAALEEEDDWDVEWLDDDDMQDAQKAGRVRNKLPAEVRYFDTAQILAKGGDGGKGCVAFRREKYVPKGGPAGGNGGRGGNVWLQADASLNSLTSFRKQVHYRAEAGSHGGGSNMTGADGSDLTIKVPPGTIVRAKNAQEGQVLAEVLQEGDRALLMMGGRGGRGNASFKSQRNKAPQLAEVGEEGQEAWLNLEMKLIADVGIIGVPNAGKSTLLSSISAAKPKIANYPFTTLVPQLGVCEMGYRTTVFADIPGLLEGAHEGRGLGHEFLRHCSRARMLVHVLDGNSPDPLGDFHAIQTELQLFAQDLTSKPQMVAYNKMDLPGSAERWQEVQKGLQQLGIPPEHILAISAATRSGLQQLVWQVQARLDSIPIQEGLPSAAVNQTQLPKLRSYARMDHFQLEKDFVDGERIFRVSGEAIERFAQMTNWDYYEAANRFQKTLEAAGINKALKKQDIKDGDTVQLGSIELIWSDNQSESAMYQAWLDDRKAKGKIPQGTARWPFSGN